MIIDKHYLTKYSPLPSNYDVTNLLPYVSTAEKIWVIPVIGYDLYEEINEQVNAPSGGTLSEENATLLTEGGLWQYLAYSTLLEGLPFIWTRISEAGIQLGKSDNSDSASLKDLTLIQSHLRNQTEVLKEFTIKWLCNHTDSFPLFDTSVCPDCGCGCNKNKGGLFSPNPKRSIYKPTIGCVGSSIVVSSTPSQKPCDLSDYYTKEETDERIDEKIESAVTSGVDLSNYWTSAQTQEAITEATSGISALTEEVAANSYTIGEIEDSLGGFALDSDVVHKKYNITETITGDKTFSGDTTFNGLVTLLGEEAVVIGEESLEDLMLAKLDASAYTPTDLSDYYTKEQVDSAITQATSGGVQSAISGVSFNGSAATVTDGVAYITVDFYSIIDSYMNRFRVVYVSGGTTYIDEYPDGIVNTTKYKNTTAITSVEIGDEITTIPSSMFENDTNLNTIKIGNKVGEIPSSFAKGCSTLSSATIPNGVTSIGGNAFNNCSGLTEFTIPNSVTTLGYGIISNSGVRTLSIGSGLSSLAYAFYDIPYLDNITVDANNPVLDSRNNCNAIIETATNKLVLGSSNTIIPNDVTSIGTSAFQGELNLTSITIPSSVTSISGYAFNGCANLSSITCYNTTPPTLGSVVFLNVPEVGTLYVPQGSDYSSWIGTGATSSSQLASGWTIVTLNDGYVLTSTINDGDEVLIVSTNEVGTAYAVQFDESVSLTAQTYETTIRPSNIPYINEGDIDNGCKFTVAYNGSGYSFTNNGYHLRIIPTQMAVFSNDSANTQYLTWNGQNNTLSNHFTGLFSNDYYMYYAYSSTQSKYAYICSDTIGSIYIFKKVNT